MKKITTLFAMLICAITMMASPVEPEQARIVALNFMMQKSPAVTRSTDCTLAYTWSNDRSTTLFYVYNVGGGFVIVAADDAVTPVLGYSTTGSFNPQNIPANCAAWLQGYADQIAYVREHNLSAPERVSQAWTDLVEGREPVRSGNSRSIAHCSPPRGTSRLITTNFVPAKVTTKPLPAAWPPPWRRSSTTTNIHCTDMVHIVMKTLHTEKSHRILPAAPTNLI